MLVIYMCLVCYIHVPGMLYTCSRYIIYMYQVCYAYVQMADMYIRIDIFLYNDIDTLVPVE